MSSPRKSGLIQRTRGPVMIESLEKRQLLTTIAGGGFTPNGAPIVNTVLYKDADDQIVRIAVGGNAVAEFIAGYVDENTNALTLGNLAPSSAADGTGADLFQVYVTQGDENSFIAISAIDPDTGAMTPYTGSLSSGLNVQSNLGPIINVNSPDGAGSIFLGARTKDINDSENEDSRAILAGTLGGALGVRPAVDDLGNDPRNVVAGLVIANQQTLGTFAFAGTVTGRVNITGSIETFYAGWLLTGDAGNDFSGATFLSNNFTVSGDARNIISYASIGTDAVDAVTAAQGLSTYQTGVDIEVGGTVGQIVSLTGGYTGKTHVTHSQLVPSMGTQQVEVEDRQFIANDVYPFEHGRLGGIAEFNNDTFATPQYLGTIADRDLGASIINVSGELEANVNSVDLNDYYAVSLLAGQTYTVQLEAEFPGALNLGVFDPTGRLIATDFSNVDQGAVVSQPFQFKADRPGVYRLAVGLATDPTFTGSGNTFGNVSYSLRMAGAGDIALGGIVTAGDQWLPQAQFLGSAFPSTDFPISLETTPIEVDSGDLGALVSGGTITARGDKTIDIANGNLRAVQAAVIGRENNTIPDSGMQLIVPNGNVGLLRTTSGLMLVNNLLTKDDSIGGNYQVVDAAGTFGGKLITDMGIGIVRAGDMAVSTPPQLLANADALGLDGFIDLIDVAGDFGTITGGGPILSTGAGGNVRYLRVGGTIWQDRFFGVGTVEPATYDPGQSVTVSDDSGSQITITPVAARNPNFVPNTPGSNPSLPAGSVSMTAYGVRGGAGLAIIDVTTTGPVNITSSGGGFNPTVEIGRLTINGTGQSVVRTTPLVTGRFTGYPAAPNLSLNSRQAALDVNIGGTAITDIYDIAGASTAFSSIVNNTGGELVNIEALSIGTLFSKTTLGLARSHTGAAVEKTGVFSNELPFGDQRNGIAVSGDIISAAANQGMGNFNVGGIIGTLSPNNDRINIPNLFEGINGPILTDDGIINANIGEGIAYSGNGAFSLAGLYSNGRIYSVTNQGLGSDIRGDVVSLGSIGDISLVNGSIINANIMVATSFDEALEARKLFVLPTNSQTIGRAIYNIGSITTSGIGGILGAWISGGSIGPIQAGGFGMLDSLVLNSTTGQMSGIAASGYGIRSVNINSGFTLGYLVANGSGANISAGAYSPSVRQSEGAVQILGHSYDPFSGVPLSRVNDLHAFLGTSAVAPQIANVTDTGVLEDVRATGSRSLNTVSAYRIRATTEDTPNNPIKGEGTPDSYPMQFAFADSIGSIRTRSLIDGLSILTGRIGVFAPATDVFRTGITVSGPIGNITVRGSLANDSYINAVGPSGIINSLVVSNDLVGSIYATSRINRIFVGNNLIGDITIMGQNATRMALGSLQLGGALADGSLIINGSVGSIVSAYTLGSTGDQLQINGNIQRLMIGTPRVPGAAMNSNVNVTGNVGQFRLYGQMVGSLTVLGTIGNLTAIADAGIGSNVIANNIAAGVNINSINIAGGNVNGNITAGANIGRVNLVGGSLNAATTLLAQAGNIGSLLIRAGNLYGSVNTPFGYIGSLSVDGSAGNGVTPLTITTQRMNLLQVGGSVLSGVTATVGGPLMNLVVNGNVEAGAVISGSPIYRRTIKGAINGTIIG
ncbi:MAG: hypothetical protein IT447_05295 [Phycisphaerales bacterium]|nr:hypothetical protein [Phycisphaerales bacterium]